MRLDDIAVAILRWGRSELYLIYNREDDEKFVVCAELDWIGLELDPEYQPKDITAHLSPDERTVIHTFHKKIQQ